MPDVCILLAYANTHAERLSGMALRRHGLTLRQYGLLTQLRQEPELTASQLARQLGVTRQSLNEMVGSLETSGLLERAPGADGRTRRMVVLPKAKSLLDKAQRAVQAAEAQALRGLSPTEARALRHLLAKVLAAATDDEAWTADARSR